MKPLVGVRVLEVSGFLAGPLLGLHLAQLGAEVIKVEPVNGDQNRDFAPFLGPRGVHLEPQTEEDVSVMYLMRAYGRRGVTLNLKSERGREIFKELAARVDIVFDNLSPGAMTRLGIDYPILREVNPQLIYASLSGFGQTGPYRDLPAFDPIIQAVSGVMSLIGEVDGRPIRTGVFYLADQITPLFAAMSLLAALRQRDQTGQGQFLDISMMDCMVSMLWMEPLSLYGQLGLPLRVGNSGTRTGPMDSYPTQDGWILLVAASNPGFQQLATALDRPDLIDDPRFRTGTLRAAHKPELDAIVEDWTRRRTSQEALDHLRAYGVACGPVNFPTDVVADPHVQERELFHPIPHPTLPGVAAGEMPRFPVRFSGAETGADPPGAPALGGDNQAILGGWLGYSEDDLAELRRAGVI